MLSDAMLTCVPTHKSVYKVHGLTPEPLDQAVAGQIMTLVSLESLFFQCDALLVRDGCFYAGLCLTYDSGTGTTSTHASKCSKRCSECFPSRRNAL